MAKRYYQGYYEGMDERRAQEAADARLINPDASAPANLPQAVVMREYPGRSVGAPEEYGDTKKSIDKQTGYDISTMKKNMKYKE